MTLTSSVEQDGRQAACPEEMVTFTCMLTRASALRWTSDRFQPVEFISEDPEQSEEDRGEFHAVLTSNVGGGLFRNITSTLSVTASVTLNGTIIYCINPGAANSSSTLNFASKPRQVYKGLIFFNLLFLLYTLPRPTLSSPAAKLLCFTVPTE